MNDYRRAMEDCPLPEGLESRMRERVLAAEPKARQKTVRPWNYARKTTLAAVVAVMLTVSAGAAVLVNWDDIFADRFGQDAASTDMAADAFQSVHVTSVCDDVTLTIREALGDDKTIYVILDYQLPETVDRAAVEQAWNTVWDRENMPDSHIVPPDLEWFATDDMTWEQLKERDGAKWAEVDWADWPSYGAYMDRGNALAGHEVGWSSGGVASQTYAPETGTMTYLARITAGADFTDRPLTLMAAPPILKADGREIALADHPAIVTFQPSYEARSVSGEAKADNAAVRATVSPLAIQVTYNGPDYPDLDALRGDTWVVYADGSAAAVTELALNGGGSQSDDGTAWRSLEFTAVLEDLLDTDRVTAIRVGDVEIPLSKPE